MSLDRVLFNIVADDPGQTATFYEALLGFDRAFDSDWLVNLKHDKSAIEIGVIKRGHDAVPNAASGKPGGGYLTFVAENTGTIAAPQADAPA